MAETNTKHQMALSFLCKFYKNWQSAIFVKPLFFMTILCLGNISIFAQTFPAGSYIIDMGIVPQTQNNALKPYGLVYEMLRQGVPVNLIINPTKTKDGIDFVHEGKQYKGGPFVISGDFATTAQPIIDAWVSAFPGLTVVVPTTSFSPPVYNTLVAAPRVALDAANGGIAQGYMVNAGIPLGPIGGPNYYFKNTQDLDCCDDFFAMPHADPTWATHSKLYDWNLTCQGSIWAACHAVSAMENAFNPANTSQQLNFLCNTTDTPSGPGPWATNNGGKGNTLMLWKQHSSASLPPSFEYDHHNEPPMQFMGLLDNATFSGSEQLYITVSQTAAQWRPTTRVAVWDDSQVNIPAGVDKAAAKVAYGRGLGDPDRGQVMYEAGHTHAGTAPANIAAQRAFLNFVLWASQDKALVVSSAGIPAEIQGGSTSASFSVTLNPVPSGPYTYLWTSGCGGDFSNDSGTFNNPEDATTATATTFTAPSAPTSSFKCPIFCKIIDACGREVFFSEAPTILSLPVSPVANLDATSTLPETVVTINPLNNDTDGNLDPLTRLGLGISGSLTSVNTGYGIFVNGPNNTVLYKPSPGFVGWDSIIYVACDLGPLCDTAFIKVFVGELVGPCGEGKTQVTLGTGTAVAYSNITGSVSNPAKSLGISDLSNYAELAVSTAAYTVDLGRTFNVGDTIILKMASRSVGSGANQHAIFKVEDFTAAPGTFTVNAVSIPAPSTTMTNYIYVIQTADSRYLRIQNTSSYSKGRIDAITYDIKVCIQNCSVTEKIVLSSKNADAVFSNTGVSNPTNALGALNGTYAEYDATTDAMVLDMGEIIPQNSAVIIYMKTAADNALPTNINVAGSATSSGFTGSVTYPVHATTVYSVYQYTITQASGVQYLQINGSTNLKRIRIDALEFPSLSCTNVLPVAGSDTLTVCEDNLITFNPLPNDLDPQGLTLSIPTIQKAPLHGIAKVNANGTITYIPSLDYSGTDSLTYRVCNTEEYCRFGTVYFTMTDDGCTTGQYKATIYNTTNVTISGVANSIDTWLDGGNTDRNNGINTTLTVDRESDQPGRTLLKFNLSSIPTGAVITSATLRLRKTNNKVETIVLHRMANSWVEGTKSSQTALSGEPTWSHRQYSTVAWTGGTGATDDYASPIIASATTTSSSNVDVNWDVKTLVQAWTDGVPNYGFLIKAADDQTITSDNAVNFSSSEGATAPQLIISYRLPDCATGPCTVIPNRLPLANDDETCTDYEESTTFNVTANDQDIDGTTAPNGLNVASVTILNGYLGFPKHGTASASASDITYTSGALNVEVDTVYYSVSDFAGGKDTALLSICIQIIPIVANNDNSTVVSGTSVTTNVSLNDSNPKGGAVTLSAQETYPPNNGTIEVSTGGIIYTPNAGFTGIDIYEYRICNDNFPPDCDIAQVTVTVLNQAPTPEPDTVFTQACSPISISPLDNDSDPENNDLYIFSIGTPTPNNLGTFSLEGSIVTFTPTATFTGSATVSLPYTVQDNGTDPAQTTSSIVVDVGAPPVNLDPIAENDTTDINSGSILYWDIITNDSDPDFDMINVTGITTSPLHGTAVILSNQLVEYTPASGFVGLDSLQYQICDSIPDGPGCSRTSQCDLAWLVVEALFVELPEIGVAKAAATPVYNGDGSFDVTYTVKVNNYGNVDLTNVQLYDTLSNTFPLPATFTIVGLPTSTDLTVNSSFTGSGANTGLLAAGQTLASGDSAIISFTVQIIPVGNPAGPFNNSVYAEGTSPIGVDVTDVSTDGSLSDPDSDGDPGNNSIQTPVTLQNYLPTADFDLDSTNAGVSVTVDVLTDDSFGIDGPGSGPITITEQGANGIASVDDNGTPNDPTDDTIVYTPNAGFVGLDTLVYEICDTHADCDTAYVAITVTPSILPVTENGTVSFETGGTAITNIADNDTVNGAAATLGASGNATVSESGSWPGGISLNSTTGAITVVAGTTPGDYPVTYELCDKLTPVNCATMVDTITVLPANTTFAVNDFNNTPYEKLAVGNVSTNDFDRESDSQVSFSLVGANGGMLLAEGTVVLNNSTGTYTYTPASGFSGETSFSYEVCDDGATSACDTAIVYLEVLPPVSTDGSPIIANADARTVLSGMTGTGTVVANDFDPEGQPFSVTTVLSAVTVSGVNEEGQLIADAGTLTLNANGSYVFVPTGTFTGVVVQPYTISTADSPAETDASVLEIRVIPNNGNSTFASDDAVVTDAGVAVSSNVSLNDDDMESDPQSVISFLYDSNGDGSTESSGVMGTATPVGGTNSAGDYVANSGSLLLNADGSYTFTPVATFSGNVIITYTVCDDVIPTPACDEATLVITVLNAKRDYGDAPSSYPDAWHRALTDINSDETLDGTNDVWLGSKTNFEVYQKSNSSATGDTHDDAITFGPIPGQFPTGALPLTNYTIGITVNSSSPNLVYYGLWIDWDNNGTYEAFYSGSQATSSPAIATATITTPLVVGAVVNIRLRADDDPLVAGDYQGGETNGEVEDYQTVVVLPVELMTFEGKENECEVDLYWVSAAEENFSHYEIERSQDGQTFHQIGQVSGTSFSDIARYYEYKDKHAGLVNYYRLKMVDLDGSYQYSEVLYETTSCNEELEMKIFPNPVGTDEGVIKVKFYSTKTQTTLEIINAVGSVVRILDLSVQEEWNIAYVDISGLPAGNYYLRNGGLEVVNFIIQKE
jgi:uncharacterized repeat protein (TIGR01451 family)